MKPINENDLRTEFKIDTGKYPNKSIEANIFVESNNTESWETIKFELNDLDEIPYIKWLEEIVCKYKNEAKAIKEANEKIMALVQETLHGISVCDCKDCDDENTSN